MNLLDLVSEFSVDASCKSGWKEYREKVGDYVQNVDPQTSIGSRTSNAMDLRIASIGRVYGATR